MRKNVCAAVLLCALAAGAENTAPPAAVKALAPTGKLRVAINLVNTVIAQRDPAGGDPKGISVDMARELARRLGVPMEFVIFEGAGKEFHAAGKDVWDVGFFGVGGGRDKSVDFTAPYVTFKGGYIVRKDSPVRTVADVDRTGTRVAVGRDSIYDLYLSSQLKNAELVRVSPAALDHVLNTFYSDQLEVVAFIRIPLVQYAKSNPQVRMVEGAFMDIRQAIATPKGRGPAGLRYLHAFVEEMKASGFVDAAVQRSGIEGVKVAPAASEEMGEAAAAPGTCEPLPPVFRSDDSRVVLEKIGPNEGSPTGNTYFFMARPFNYVVVHLNPSTSDTAPYVVKLISRYTDDTIYEPLVQTIYPKANVPYKWGPIAVMARKVPKGKIADMFNVKVQENYAMDPNAKGFTYTVRVDGCN